MSWTKICKTSDVPEKSVKKFWAGGGTVPLVIAHHKGGFRAMPPMCPHMEEPLEESGVIAGCVLTCTKHLWSWDLETLELQGETEKPLKLYEVKIEGDDLMAFIEEELVYDFDDDDDMDDDDFFNS